MRRFIILMLFVIPSQIISQDFAPIGSNWHYTQWNPYFDVFTYKTFESISETIIDSVNCKKLLEVERYNSDTLTTTTHFMYSENDSVFFYMEGEFHLLYDFGATTGDTIVLDYFWTASGDPLEMIIDSTSTIDINGILRVIQYITCGDGIVVGFGEHVIEGIGSTYFMFPTYDGTVNGPLRCYEDTLVNLFYNPFHPLYGWNFNDCDEVLTEVAEVVDNQDIRVFPNPAISEIKISGNNGPINFCFINSLGCIVKQGQIMNGNSINISELSNGVYYLLLDSNIPLNPLFIRKAYPVVIIN